MRFIAINKSCNIKTNQKETMSWSKGKVKTEGKSKKGLHIQKVHASKVDMQNELPWIWFRLLVFDQDKKEKKYNEKKQNSNKLRKKRKQTNEWIEGKTVIFKDSNTLYVIFIKNPLFCLYRIHYD